MITILIPVLARPQNAAKVFDSIASSTKVEYEVIFLTTAGDEEEHNACVQTGAMVIETPGPAGPGNYAMKINLGYTLGANPFVLLAADDLEFEPGWDVAVLKQADRSGAGVIGTNDQANPLVVRGKHSTHPLVRRTYIDTVGGTWHDGPGIVYHLGYSHQFVDTELVNAAMQRDEWSFAMTSIVRHMHPMYGHRGRERTPMDDTYRIALADGQADKVLYQERERRATASGNT